MPNDNPSKPSAGVHSLRTQLESARLDAIEAAVATISQSGAATDEEFRRIAQTQLVLQAVCEVIDSSEPRLGGGSGTIIR